MPTKIYLADLIHAYSPDDLAACPETREMVHGSFVVPYGVACVAAYTKKIFCDTVDISLFKFADDLLAAADDAAPDVIAFSNYMWNSHLNLTIGTKLRERFPDVLIVVGGPSVRTDETGIIEYLQNNAFVDVCILHEGERPFAEVVAAYQDSRRDFITKARPIKNAGYLSNGRLVCMKSDRFEELDELPSPYLEGYLDNFISQGFIPLFETNRGCPFKCTYCAWGAAAVNKVRKFSLEKVFAELDYVSGNFPDCSSWLIADANFGILPRDIEIAHKIQQIMSKNHALHLIVYESKNTPGRNAQIARLLRNADSQDGRQTDNVLIALQTLDAATQEAIKRSNIKLGNIPENVRQYQEEGLGVRTDLLSGLPRETMDSHMGTLRRVFAYGFDHIGIYNVILLPGTEMETQLSRDAYQLFTRFRARDGSFGNYQGTRSVEAEEVICGNSAISKDELMTLRLVHWVIWYGWNHGFLKPVLRYALNISRKNPADVLYQLVTGEGVENKCIQDFFISLRNEYSSEFFESAESLREFYHSDKGWSILTAKRRRAGFIYNAKLVDRREFFTEMLSALRDIVTANTDTAHYDEVCRVLLQMRIEPASIHAGEIEPEVSVSIPSNLTGCFFPRVPEFGKKKYNFILKKTIKQQENIRNSLRKHFYADNSLFAICNTLDDIPDAFAYDLVDAKI